MSSTIKITIDNTKIDDTLTDFPLMVHLSTSCGTNLVSMAHIFSVLGDEKYKIQIYDSGNNQLYCEIERWDEVNFEIILWIKVPTISSTADTNIYIRYDDSFDDNTTYVGLTGSAVAANVWDSNYKLVWHMNAAPASILDATANNNDVGSVNSAPVLEDGLVSQCLNFDGTDDFLHINDNASLDIATHLCFEAFFTLDDLTPDARVLAAKWASATGRAYQLGFIKSTGKMMFYINNDAGPESNTSFASTPIDWTYCAGSYNGTTMQLWLDAAEDNTFANTDAIGVGTTGFRVGSYEHYGWYHDGKIAEIRLSDDARSDAYRKATNYTLRDNLCQLTRPVYTVTIAPNNEDGNTYYTTDGSTPDKYSNRYTAPFSTDLLTTVKAIVIDDDYIDSAVASGTAG